MHVMGRLLSRYKTKRPGPFLHVNIHINTNLDVNSVASYVNVNVNNNNNILLIIITIICVCRRHCVGHGFARIYKDAGSPLMYTPKASCVTRRKQQRLGIPTNDTNC